MDVGARVWVTDPGSDSVWLAARILDVHQKAVTVELETQSEKETTKSHFGPCDSYDENDKAQTRHQRLDLVLSDSGECINVLPRNIPREQDQRDLVALPHLHEASILNALRLRYERHAIYTHIGDILISINPFQDLLHLYGDEVLQNYIFNHTLQPCHRVTATDTREPHLFAVARAAYMDIVQNGRSQSILISGESGAGKTEATKIIMTYFAVTCGASSKLSVSTGLQSNSPPTSPSRTSIEEQVLQSNPILEAFGNARTVRNDNSSRFGKFIELRFRDERQRLAGARIRTYLLEKIRVIKQAPHERNFHIFYELLSADVKYVTKEQKKFLALDGGPKSFRLLNQSMCCKRRDGVKDAVQFCSTRKAMQQLGMSEQEISGVMEIVAAVLHMGNVDFEQVPHKREDNVFVDEARVKTSRTGLCDHFTKVAELLGVSTDALDHALTKRSLHASNEVLVVGVDVTQARNTCNALTMECYRLLFEWLVARINIKLQRHGSVEWDADADETDDEEEATDFIGLLDIFGFENMAENSFEQLCINYANEALQHQFNQYVFEEEQRLYRAEAIRWNFVDFPDNSACLELFEQRPIGIFSLTDQECVFPQGTDRALVAKFYLEFETKKIHPRFRSAPKFHRTTQFIVAHYAGSVIYSIEGFLAKNKDSFCESAAQLLAGSMNPFVQALAARSSNGDGFNGESELDGGRNRRRAKSAIAAISVGTQFKIQLNELLNTVRATTPRYVRCIKPNDLHVGSLFQSTRVVEQLRSGGVLEAVRVARAGFPVRLSHKQFLERYRRILLWLYELKNNGIDKKKHRNWSELDLCLHQLIRFLLTDSKSETGEDGAEGDQENEQNRCGVSLGKTRVFFRRTPYEKLENLRISVRQESSLVIQRQLKGFVARCNYRRLRQFTIVVQTWVRGRRAYRYVNWMRAMRQAQVLQARMRQLCARSKFLRARAGVLAVQCRFRCRLASRVLQALRECRAVTQIATAWRRFSAEHKYSKLCSATLALQCAVRAHTARKTLKLLRNESRDLAKLKEDNAQLKDELAELRRQMQVLVAHSSSKERQQASYSNFKFFEKSPQNAPFPSNETPAEFDNNKCITQLKLELSDDLVTVDTGGNPNAANGSDFGCVVDLPYSHHKLEQQTPTLRRGRRYSLPPALAPANEDAEVEHATPPAPPRAFRPHDRRYSLELWWRQEAEAQKEATQLREVIREAAADVFSPERQQQQELALQQLVASQIKRKTMQLQLQLPAFELGANNKDIDSGPASSICSRRRSRTADFLQGPAPLTSCGRQSRSRWNFAAPHSMTHGGNCRMPAYFDNPSYAGSSYGDDHSVDGGDEIYSRSHQVPRRSASVGVCRVRSSSNASSFNMPPSSNIRPGVVIPRFAKSPTCYECDCKFSFLLRRHHCRQCGNSFCFEHSTRQLALPHLGYMTAQRVCDSCFEAHIHIMTSLKLPSLMRNATDELSTSSFASSPRGLDSYCGFDSPTTTAARVAPLRT